jgi:ELWxxDGT repeat protein
MPAKRALSAALALLLVAAIPARAGSVPTLTVIDSIRPGYFSSYALDYYESVALGDYLYFAAEDDTHGAELWRTNGTTTTLVKDINTGTGGAENSYPQSFAAFGDYLYFRANDGVHGFELWRTNGTDTTLVKDINTNGTGGADSSGPHGFTALNGYLYFQANDGTHGDELWRTDGTAAGTTLVKDINLHGVGGAESSAPYGLTVLGGYLYFAADDGINGVEVWRTDGIETGMFADINTTLGGSDPMLFTAFNGYLYFRANDLTHGAELWRTNGITTELVKDINADHADNANPGYFTALGGYLYFQANDGTHGYELWRTNGTAAGTTMVEDINAGSDNSSPYQFTALGGYLYFNAHESTHGYELWRTNGTITELVMDINTNGAAYSDPRYFTALGEYIYFSAEDGTNGRELWRTDGTATEKVPFSLAGQFIDCDCADNNIVAVGGRLYTTVYSDAIGREFAYLDEPTYVLPSTDRSESGWTTTLVILAGLTAAASIGLRLMGAKRASR